MSAMTVSLTKPVSPYNGYGMDNEAWNSRVLLPMYLATVYPPNYVHEIYTGLTNNDPRDFYTLLQLEHRYDNTTGELANER